MIQFNLNQDLANDLVNLPIVSCDEITKEPPELGAHSVPQHGVLGAMVWFAHEVTLNNQKCVIAMEWRSGYVMVFCGLTRLDFNNFEMLFTQRLWREACVITQLEAPLPEEDIAIITGLALELSQQQYFYVQANCSVQNQINQVNELLHQWVEEEGNALPVEDEAALHFGLAANEMLRSRKDNSRSDVPIEVYRKFWLGFVLHVQDKYMQDRPVQPTDDPFCIKEFQFSAGSEGKVDTSLDKTELPRNPITQFSIRAPSSNVIQVDFITKRKL